MEYIQRAYIADGIHGGCYYMVFIIFWGKEMLNELPLLHKALVIPYWRVQSELHPQDHSLIRVPSDIMEYTDWIHGPYQFGAVVKHGRL